MKKSIIFASAIFTLSILTSCVTVKNIPDTLSAAQLIQYGQNAYGIKQYDNAEKYFLTTIERFGDDTTIYVEAQYELGHLYLEKKNYKKAYYSFKNVLSMYDYSSSLPGSYRKLCLIEIEKIPEAKLNELEKMAEQE